MELSSAREGEQLEQLLLLRMIALNSVKKASLTLRPTESPLSSPKATSICHVMPDGGRGSPLSRPLFQSSFTYYYERLVAVSSNTYALFIVNCSRSELS